MISFLHCADLHLDSSFSYLFDKEKKKQRNIELRSSIEKMLFFAKEKQVDFILISGDVFDNENATLQTCRYVDQLFSNIHCPIIIILGNHDKVGGSSLLMNYSFSSNVTILNEETRQFTYQNVKIHYGDSTFFNQPLDENFDHILMWHGDLAATMLKDGENPLSLNFLDSKKVIYVAMGHIHQYQTKQHNQTLIVYPGCLMGRGFDELNQKGFVYNELQDHQIISSFIPLKNRMYKEIKIDVSDKKEDEAIQTFIVESLKEKMQTIEDYHKHLYKVILTGRVKENFDFELAHLDLEEKLDLYYVEIKNRIQLDETEIENELLKQFIKLMDEKIKNCLESEKEVFLRAKELGIKAFNQNK